MNRKAKRATKTGFKGVHYCNREKKFIAKIVTNGKTIYLGSFDDKIKAGEAYNSGAVRYHGEFARLNTI